MWSDTYISAWWTLYHTVKEVIFVGKKFRTFPYKTFRAKFNFALSEWPKEVEQEETIKRSASQVEENLVWKIISRLFFFFSNIRKLRNYIPYENFFLYSSVIRKKGTSGKIELLQTAQVMIPWSVLVNGLVATNNVFILVSFSLLLVVFLFSSFFSFAITRMVLPPPPPPPTTLIPHIEVGFKWMWTQLATPNKMAPVFVDLCAGLVVLLPRQIRRFRHGFFSSAVLDWSLRSCVRVRHLWRQQIADNRRYLRRSFLPWTSSLRSQISLSKRQ